MLSIEHAIDELADAIEAFKVERRKLWKGESKALSEIHHKVGAVLGCCAYHSHGEEVDRG